MDVGASEAAGERVWEDFARSLRDRAVQRGRGDEGAEPAGREAEPPEEIEFEAEASDDDEAENEARKVKRMMDPKRPSLEEA